MHACMLNERMQRISKADTPRGRVSIESECSTRMNSPWKFTKTSRAHPARTLLSWYLLLVCSEKAETCLRVYSVKIDGNRVATVLFGLVCILSDFIGQDFDRTNSRINAFGCRS